MAGRGARPGVQDCRPNPGVDVDRPGECCVDTREHSLPSAGVDVRLRLHGGEAELDELAAADHPGLELGDCRPAHSAQCWAWRHGEFWPVEAGGQRGCGQLSGAGRPALTACVWPTPGTRSHRTLARFGARTSAGNTRPARPRHAPANKRLPHATGTPAATLTPTALQRARAPPRPRGTNGCLTLPEHPQNVPARAGRSRPSGRAGGRYRADAPPTHSRRTLADPAAPATPPGPTPPQTRRSGSRPPTSPRD